MHSMYVILTQRIQGFSKLLSRAKYCPSGSQTVSLFWSSVHPRETMGPLLLAVDRITH